MSNLITPFGFTVVYGGCPRSRAGGVWWERSDYGALSSVSCPPGTSGVATRLCDRSLPGWRTPDVFNCTSNSFLQLRRLVSIFFFYFNLCVVLTTVVPVYGVDFFFSVDYKLIC